MFLQGHGDINKNSLVNMQNRDNWVFVLFLQPSHIYYTYCMVTLGITDKYRLNGLKMDACLSIKVSSAVATETRVVHLFQDRHTTLYI